MGQIAYVIGKSAELWFPRDFCGSVTVQAALVPPDANAGSCFELKLFQNVLDVLLHCPRTAFENFPDLVVALSRDDPFDDFEFAAGQIRRLGLGDTQAL